MPKNIITKTFKILIISEKINVEIDYELVIRSKHFITLKYKDWIIDIYTQKTNENECEIKMMTIRVIEDEWILFSDEDDDYPIRDTKEIDDYCYRICFKKNKG